MDKTFLFFNVVRSALLNKENVLLLAGAAFMFAKNMEMTEGNHVCFATAAIILALIEYKCSS